VELTSGGRAAGISDSWTALLTVWRVEDAIAAVVAAALSGIDGSTGSADAVVGTAEAAGFVDEDWGEAIAGREAAGDGLR